MEALKAVLGLDIGTTAAKALLVSLDGEVLGEGHYPYGMLRVGKNGYEQEPEEFWKGMIASCEQALSQVRSGVSVLALALSTQAGTTIPLGKGSRPLCNAISWMDHRGERYKDKLLTRCSPESFYQRSGWKLTSGSSILHILRLQYEEPEIFNSTQRFAFVNDFLIQRLTGKFCMDPSNAGITNLYNIRQGDWDEDLLRLLDLDHGRLSQITASAIPIGNLTEEAAEALGLSQDTIVVNGAHDQYCAALGTGICNPGDVLISTGTAWVMLTVCSDIELAYDTGWVVSRYPVSELYGALISAGAVGKGMSWFTDRVLSVIEPKDTDEWIDVAVAESPIGANGLVFISPAVARREGTVSGFVNLDIDHSLKDMVRAIMEGTVYEINRLNVNSMTSGDLPPRVVVAGRPAENKMWAQMLSDVLELPLQVPKVREAASYGAAILASLGVGVINDANWRAANCETLRYEPSCDRSHKYRRGFTEYVEVLNRCRGGMCHEKTT